MSVCHIEMHYYSIEQPSEYITATPQRNRHPTHLQDLIQKNDLNHRALNSSCRATAVLPEHLQKSQANRYNYQKEVANPFCDTSQTCLCCMQVGRAGLELPCRERTGLTL